MAELQNDSPDLDLKDLDKDKLQVYADTVHNKVFAVSFLKRSDRKRYNTLLDSLDNKFFLIIEYLLDLAAILRILDYYVKPPQPRHRNEDNESQSNIYMSFVQASSRDKPVPGTDGVIHKGITCFGCNDSGHYRNKCSQSNVQLVQYSAANQDIITPTDNNDNIVNGSNDATTENDNDIFVAFGFLQIIRNRNQARRNMVTHEYIHLDSESTVCKFCTPYFVSNICPHNSVWSVEVHTNVST